MADRKSTQPIIHFVEVRFEREDVRLVIDAPSLPVRPGDRVWWVFRGVPGGWTPWISAVRPLAPAPFERITQSPWGVRATIAASAGGGAVAYRATVQRGLGSHHPEEGALLRSAVAELVVDAEVEPRLHRVQVSYRPGEEGGVGSLEVSPEWVKMRGGDAVVWEFSVPEKELDPGSWRPRVDFVRFDGPADPPNLHLGPFSTLTYEGERVLAAGDARTPGVYSYLCLLVARLDGRVLSLSSPDPAIDCRGEPPSSG